MFLSRDERNRQRPLGLRVSTTAFWAWHSRACVSRRNKHHRDV